jgi:hypothetical protein
MVKLNVSAYVTGPTWPSAKWRRDSLNEYSPGEILL